MMQKRIKSEGDSGFQSQQPDLDPTGSSRYSWMERSLQQLKGWSRLRELHETSWSDGGYVMREGRRLLNLASNHYLGLSPWLEDYIEQIRELIAAGGEPYIRMGSGASRLISGHDPQHEALEAELASFMERERVLVFTSGYMANVGVIQALVGRNDAVFSDRLNHASIVDGIQLSRAKHFRYPHRDLERLENMLKSWSEQYPTGRALIVTDAIFSMDGTKAPLHKLVELKERYGAMLMVDEAHSIGVYGDKGKGLAYHEGLHQHVDLIMGTLGKAFGLEGAFIAADGIVVDYLINHARTFIYNTAMPPMMAAMLRIRLREVQEAAPSRERLMQHANLLRGLLQESGFDTGEGDSHIVPVLLGDDRHAVKVSEAILQTGIAGIAIRPPTVPQNEARIRLTPMAIHTTEQLTYACNQFIQAVGRG